MLPTALLSRLRLADRLPATVLQATALQPPTARRSVYHFRLTNRQDVKVRLVPRPQVRRRMERWIPRLDWELFPRIMGSHGRIVIEQWFRGPSLGDVAPTGNHFEESGRTLAMVHGAVPIDTTNPRGGRFQLRLEKLRRSLVSLCAAGTMSRGAAAEILDGVMQRLPPIAHWGLMHRDFSPANLVLRRDKVCCIDNVDVATGFLEEDLALTFFRWPMMEGEQRRFVHGYASGAVADSWATHRPFWSALALVAAAAWRYRGGWPNVQEPLRQLSAR